MALEIIRFIMVSLSSPRLMKGSCSQSKNDPLLKNRCASDYGVATLLQVGQGNQYTFCVLPHSTCADDGLVIVPVRP